MSLTEILENCTYLEISPKSNFGCEFGIFNAGNKYCYQKSQKNEREFTSLIKTFYASNVDVVMSDSDGEVLYEHNNKKNISKLRSLKQTVTKTEDKKKLTIKDIEKVSAQNIIDRVVGNKQRKSDEKISSIKVALESTKQKPFEEMVVDAKDISELLKKGQAPKEEYVKLYARLTGLSESQANESSVKVLKDKLSEKADSILNVLRKEKEKKDEA